MTRLDGKKLASEIELELKKETSKSLHHLAIIQVGNDFSSSIYIKKKMEVCSRIGIKTSFYKLEKPTQEELLLTIDKLNKNQRVHGILLQLPLPKEMNPDVFLQAIAPVKDVDVFLNQTLELKTKDGKSPLPCVMNGILHLKQTYKLSWDGKKIVIIGKGRTGGQPIINWFKKNNYQTYNYEKNDPDINEKIKDSDILITAIGNSSVIDTTKLKPGVIFFDIGISRNQNNKVTGDINYQIAEKIASFGTPVPGGIGPLTIVMLLKNLIILKRIQDEKK
ncbi:bifunctional 5,10-methylenetetrahydrofolate dehydrogenase/5,10-methenyltetrahydrofolate cyclohydrolase [[Mycoplasma] testudinis]|uniref:bifunctional 5,10-methylenetetrahydrofolate dehydrogenase/5,10-methenyltetrahydrofolate cyclohydrolase n=1 Tax=[Mycoplasma] testudinis TaxID=33924 RepID=UPI00048607AA|nr:bifunctional 5,10-methylenetetrahydrofolate dehydrogenase/5,10-methenyltetrahydrofolate cyclohydrolase [[Mycoplasma] testudinis]